MTRSILHWINNLPLAIDFLTTGPSYEEFEMAQISLLALDHNFECNKEILPFSVNMLTKHPNKLSPGHDTQIYNEIRGKGLPPTKVAELLVEWVEKIDIKDGKKFVLIGYNMIEKWPFLVKWLGPVTCRSIFSEHMIDVLQVARYLNDLLYFKAEKIPFPKVALQLLCNRYEIKINRKDSLQQALAIASLYRSLLKFDLSYL